MEFNKKTACHYGAKCYRKNKKHLEEFTHPPKSSNVKSNTNILVKNRKMGNDFCIQKETDNKAHDFKEGDKNREPNITEQNVSQRKSPAGEKRKIFHDVDIKKNAKKVKVAKDSKSKEQILRDNFDNEGEPETESFTEDSSNENSDVKSNSWTYIKPLEKTELQSINATNISKDQLIKSLYLVEMPPDFYSFFKFCETVNCDEPLNALVPFKLNLVGPFDLLAGKITKVPDNELMLCHWRFFYDPPEFQTVLASECGFHMGYWRDDPQEPPVFVGSNDSSINCKFIVEGENIFGAVFHYLTQFIKECNPFSKTKATKFQKKLKEWAETNKFTLEKITPGIKNRQKRINSKTFHGAGIVVPVEKKTEVGYRPLIESDAKIRKICQLIIDADTENREILMTKLQPLITAANIANDECDFGNSLELGIDLFCMGSHLFHNLVDHLLSTAYSLLNRSEFGDIMKSHLKNRRKGSNLSTI